MTREWSIQLLHLLICFRMTYIDVASPIVVPVVSGLRETSGSYSCIYSEAQRSRQAARPCCNNKSHIIVLKLVLAQAQQFIELKKTISIRRRNNSIIFDLGKKSIRLHESHANIRLRKIDRFTTSIFDS